MVDIKAVTERQPFRPCSVRLSNGARYTFQEPHHLGAPRNYHGIFYFGDTDRVLRATENTVEIVTQA